MERQPEQPLLEEIGLYVVLNVQERLLEELAVFIDDADAADPLDDEETATAVPGVGDVDRVDQSGGNLDELDRRIAGQCAAGSHCRS